MNSVIKISAVLLSVLLCSCNGSTSKDEVVVRIGSSNITRADVYFAMGTKSKGAASRESLVVASLVSTRVRSEIAKVMAPQAKEEVKNALLKAEERDLAHSYSQVYVRRNYAHTVDEISAWFKKNAKASSLQGLDPEFIEDRDSIAYLMALEEKQKDIQDFFNSHPELFKSVDSVELGVLSNKDSLPLVKALGLFKSGRSFDSIARTFITDTNLAQRNGRLGRVSFASVPSILVGVPNLQAMLFSRDTRIPEGQLSAIMRSHIPSADSSNRFIAFYPIKYVDSKPPRWEDNKNKAALKYFEKWRKEQLLGTKDSLLKVYKVERMPIPPVDIAQEYEKRKGEFQTQPTFKLLHIQAKDSLQLAKKVASIKSEKDFRQLAAIYNDNAFSKKNSGELGLIKQNHCLPNGIGMLPDLFIKLSELSIGQVTPVLRGVDSPKWHVFWLVQSIPPQQKPLDRVKVALESQLKASPEQVLDSGFVLVKSNGSPIVLERDVIYLRTLLPPEQRREYRREKLTEILVEWNIFAKAARSLNLQKTNEFRTMVSFREAEEWAGVYEDSVLRGYLGYPRQQLEKEYASKAKTLFKDLEGKFQLSDAARWLAIPDFVYQRELAERPTWYPDIKDWKSGKEKMFGFLRTNDSRGIEERLLWSGIQKVGIEFLEPKYKKYYWYSPQDYFKRGMEAYNRRNLPLARAEFQRVLDVMGYDTLAFRTSMLVAQILSEEENFPEAIAKYSSTYALWPNHPDSYKALFMKGFILTENLKQDSLALPAFQELVKRFPKCELADDADWMIRNIQSGGALIPALFDSLTQEEGTPVP